MRIAFFATLYPVKSGVSGYCQTLLPELARLFDIDVFIDDYEPVDTRITSSFEVLHYLRFERRFAAHRYDAIVYQMGNEVCHKFMYHYIYNFPGLLVLHDYNLHPSRASMLRAAHEEELYLSELEDCLGPKGRQIGRLVCKSERFKALLETFPMNEKLLRSSIGVIVHNAYVKELVARRVPGLRVDLVNMPIAASRNVPGKAKARKALGIPREAFVIVMPGHIAAHRKPKTALQAFARFVKRHPNALLVFAGRCDAETRLERLIASAGLKQCAQVTGYITENRFRNYIAAADVVLNLRTNRLRETSATMLYAMSLARPVIATQLAHTGWVPHDCCLWVQHSPDEANELLARLEEVFSDPESARKTARRARGYVLKNHSPKAAALAYKTAILAACGQNAKQARRPKTLRERLGWLDQQMQKWLAELLETADPAVLRHEMEDALSSLGLGTEKED